MIPPDLILETNKVILRPLAEDDYDAFLAIAKQDEDMWYYFSFNLGDERQLKNWMAIAFAEKACQIQEDLLPLLIKHTGHIAGSSSMGNISYHDLRPRSAGAGWERSFAVPGLNIMPNLP